MSEFESSSEFESRELSAIYRYYDYVNDANGNAATVIVAITELLDHLPAQVNLSVEQVFDAAEYEALFAVGKDRTANEALALLPLMYIGPLLKKSNCSAEELQTWYDDAVKMTLIRTRDRHDNFCLMYDEGNLQHCRCEGSDICPQRFLSRYLSDDAWLPDFTRKKYQEDPARARAIVINKLRIGQKYGSILPVNHDTMLSVYETAYQAHIDDLVRQEMCDIDNFNFK